MKWTLLSHELGSEHSIIAAQIQDTKVTYWKDINAFAIVVLYSTVWKTTKSETSENPNQQSLKNQPFFALEEAQNISALKCNHEKLNNSKLIGVFSSECALSCESKYLSEKGRFVPDTDVLVVES